MAKKDVKKTALILSDIHSCFMDKKAVAAAQRVGERLEPDLVIQIGDLMDFYSMSKFDKDPRRMREASLSKEIQAVQPIVKWMDEVSKDPPWYTLGNHEKRFETYLMHNVPAYYEFKDVTVQELVGIPERWKVFPYGDVPRFGKLGITHGDVVRKNSGATALAMHQKVGGSILHGHTHRMGMVHHTDTLGTHWAYEIGHLANPRPDYVTGIPNWEQGFAVAYTGRNGEFHVELVRVVNGRAWWQGEWI